MDDKGKKENREEEDVNGLPQRVSENPTYDFHYGTIASGNICRDTGQQPQLMKSEILVLPAKEWDGIVKIRQIDHQQHQQENRLQLLVEKSNGQSWAENHLQQQLVQQKKKKDQEQMNKENVDKPQGMTNTIYNSNRGSKIFYCNLLWNQIRNTLVCSERERMACERWFSGVEQILEKETSTTELLNPKVAVIKDGTYISRYDNLGDSILFIHQHCEKIIRKFNKLNQEISLIEKELIPDLKKFSDSVFMLYIEYQDCHSEFYIEVYEVLLQSLKSLFMQTSNNVLKIYSRLAKKCILLVCYLSRYLKYKDFIDIETGREYWFKKQSTMTTPQLTAPITTTTTQTVTSLSRYETFKDSLKQIHCRCEHYFNSFKFCFAFGDFPYSDQIGGLKEFIEKLYGIIHLKNNEKGKDFYIGDYQILIQSLEKIHMFETDIFIRHCLKEIKENIVLRFEPRPIFWSSKSTSAGVDHAGQVVQAIDLYQQGREFESSSAPPSVVIQFPSFPSNLRLIGQVCSRKSNIKPRKVQQELELTSHANYLTGSPPRIPNISSFFLTRV
ncbi:hypothetical protein ACTA71_004201 [Dictyostelium dimigraforme]